MHVQEVSTGLEHIYLIQLSHFLGGRGEEQRAEVESAILQTQIISNKCRRYSCSGSR